MSKTLEIPHLGFISAFGTCTECFEILNRTRAEVAGIRVNCYSCNNVFTGFLVKSREMDPLQQSYVPSSGHAAPQHEVTEVLFQRDSQWTDTEIAKWLSARKLGSKLVLKSQKAGWATYGIAEASGDVYVKLDRGLIGRCRAVEAITQARR
jgi:hypothetical protein